MLCTAVSRKGTKCQKKAIDSSGLCRYHHEDASLLPSDGKVFEEEVFKILRVLGYTVKQNVLIYGSQVDIYAEILTGIIPLRLMVECKDYGDHKYVGISDINKFAGALAVARNNGVVDKGLFVTTNGYTAEAKDNARRAGIELTTYCDLSTQLVNFDRYIDQVIADFENSQVYKYYVDLTGTEVEDYEGNEDAKLHRPVDNFIQHYLFEDNQSKLSLLGNFGTGKSTFCLRYAYNLAKQYKKNKTSRIPVIISLKDYDSKFHIQHLILNTLQINYGINITLPVLQALQRIGKFIFLFDGFDEMDAKANPDTIRDNLRELNKITEMKGNKFIVTCRTHFFRNKVQAEVLADFKILYIPEWGEVELEEYLKNRFEDKWETYLSRISVTHNLPELARTPLFLEMITETLPKLGDEVKRVELYRVYTDNWIKNQSKRKGALLSPNERSILIKELAVKLYNENRLTCHYSELLDVLRHYLSRVQSEDDRRFEIDNAVQMDYLRNDVQTCTFLVRDSAGNYSFQHKSFMEFFVAQTLSEDIRKGSVKYLEGSVLPGEIKGFLIDFLKEDTPTDKLITLLNNTKESILRDNLLTITLGLKINISNSITKTEAKNASELDLHVQFLQGNTLAFDELYRRYYPVLYSWAYKYLKQSDVIEDIVADTFLGLWKYKEKGENINHLKSYLEISIRNKVFDHLRKQNKTNNLIDEIASFHENIWDTQDKLYDTEHSKLKIEEAIEKLTPREHLIINASYMQGKTMEEIARELNINPSTARSIRFNALKRIKMYLNNRKEE